MRIFSYVMAVVLQHWLFAIGAAQVPSYMKSWLALPEELRDKYNCSVYAEAPTGQACFYGYPIVNPRHREKRGLFLLDKKSLEVRPLRSEQIEKCLGPKAGCSGLAFNWSGTKIAAVVNFIHWETVALFFNIVVIDVSTLEARAVVADGQVNYAPSFSPNDRYLAFYTTERQASGIPSDTIPLRENAGRVLDLKTSEIRTITEAFTLPADRFRTVHGHHVMGPPVWLDDIRVLFTSQVTDRGVIQKYLSGFAGERASHYAVANLVTSETKRLFLPGDLRGDAADFLKQRLYFSSGQKIIETDYDLNVIGTVMEAEEGQEIVLQGIENGQLNYRTFTPRKANP